MGSSAKVSAYLFLSLFGPGKKKGAQGEEQIRAAIVDGIRTNWKFLLPLVTVDNRSLPSCLK